MREEFCIGIEGWGKSYVVDGDEERDLYGEGGHCSLGGRWERLGKSS